MARRPLAPANVPGGRAPDVRLFRQGSHRDRRLGALGAVVARRLSDSAPRLALIDRETGRLPRSGRRTEAELPPPGSPSRPAISPMRRRYRERWRRSSRATAGSTFCSTSLAPIVAARRSRTLANELDDALGGDFLSALHLCRAVAPQMRRQGGGAMRRRRFEGIARWRRRSGAYSIAKTVVVRLTESLAAEGEATVRVNAVFAGPIDTPANRRADARFRPRAWVEPEAVGRRNALPGVAGRRAP